jgi:hypothetical protein
MIFTNARSYNGAGAMNKIQDTSMMFSQGRMPNQNIIHIPNKVQVVKFQTYEEKVSVIQDGKKIKWGEPFWFLFHVLAEKVRESEFPRLRAGILNLVLTICSNLPCPECTGHATRYLNGINFNTIRTKEDFKMMLYNFHNTVNARKQYPVYPVEALSKYALGNVVPIIENFMRHFLQNHRSFHLLADDMQRRQISGTVARWFRENIGAFYP